MYQTNIYEGMIAETVTLPGNQGELINAYFARPLGAGPFPGMVVIHHMPGWDEWYREATRKFAHHGYATISPNLYFRDGRYFDQKEKNDQPVFWSRGNGWVMGGLVRMMNNIKPGDPARAAFEKQFKEMAAKVASLQNEDGTWHAALLDQDSYPAKETSGTGFFLYALTWGVNNGLLEKETYRPVIVKAWAALQSTVHPDGKLGFVQMIAAAPGIARVSGCSANH